MFNKFFSDESGAVTVDWVVLTGAVVGLGIATYGVVSGGVQNLSGDVDTHMRQDWIDTAWWTGPTIIEKGLQRGYVEPSVCERGSPVCTPEKMHLTTTYTMSDNSNWYQSTVHENGELVSESWSNDQGEKIDGVPPEATAEQLAAYKAEQTPIRVIDPIFIVEPEPVPVRIRAKVVE